MNLTRLSTTNLLGTESLKKSDYAAIFQLASLIEGQIDHSEAIAGLLSGKSVVNLFVEDSTRTRNSFQLAAGRLGAEVLNVTGSGSSFSKGESLLDTVHVLESFQIDALVVRHAAAGVPGFLAERCSSVIVNAGDGRHEHPTQALLDAWTLHKLWGGGDGSIEGKRIGIVGDITHGRVALSNIFSLQTLGAEVLLCGPPTLIPRGIESLGVRVTNDFDQLLEEVDACMMLRMQLERQDRAYVPSMREYSRGWGLTGNRLEAVGKRDLPVLHPGPINRGVELFGEVTDGSSSLVLHQTANGVFVRMAVLALLLSGDRLESLYVDGS